MAGAAVIFLSGACDSGPASPGHPPPVNEGPPAALHGGQAPTPPELTAARSNCPRAPYGPYSDAPGRNRTVALTFDDGPGRSTAQILRMLRTYRVPATFFNIGENEAVRRSLVKDEFRAGDALGNHTWNHPDMTRLSAGQQAAEMDRTIAEQRSIVGVAPCLYRPPYGTYTATTLRLAQHRHMGVWLWSVDTEDWEADGIGLVVLGPPHHPAGGAGRKSAAPPGRAHAQPACRNPATVSALPTIIHFFRVHGYHFVRL